jgi:hypothetical protein
MHYTSNDGNFNPALAYTNTDNVLQTTTAEQQYLFQYNNTNTNTVPAMIPPLAKGSNQIPDFSPRVAQKRAERDEPLEEGLVMHIREAFLPFNDPSPTTRASKRYTFIYTRSQLFLQAPY